MASITLKNQSLYRDKIPGAIEEFVNSVEGLSYTLTSDKNDQHVYKLTSSKSHIFVSIFYKNNGLVTVSANSSGKLEELTADCVNYIVEKTSLPDTVHKTFSIRDSNVAQYPYFKEAISETLNVEDIGTKDPYVSNRFKVTDSTGASQTITLYANNTLYFQGRVTPMFITIVGFALEWMTNDVQTLDNYLELKNMVFEFKEDPAEYINDTSHFYPEGEFLLKQIRTSLVLANSGIIVDDYSCYTFNILRSLEGLLKLRMLEDTSTFENFKPFFKKDRSTNTYKFEDTVKTYDINLPLKRALERTYTFFKKYRVPTFHVDDEIETSTTLTYQEAISVIQEAFVHINDICDNWD